MAAPKLHLVTLDGPPDHLAETHPPGTISRRNRGGLQRGFPSAKQVPIEGIAGDTAYARITTPWPLRGTGNTEACWRMMEYDRVIAAAAGGQFVVLSSQAEPGITACRVALRLKCLAIDELVPAHVRAPGPGRPIARS